MEFFRVLYLVIVLVKAVIEWTFSCWHEPRHRGRLKTDDL